MAWTRAPWRAATRVAHWVPGTPLQNDIRFDKSGIFDNLHDPIQTTHILRIEHPRFPVVRNRQEWKLFHFPRGLEYQGHYHSWQ
jgi:hypothetical protein